MYLAKASTITKRYVLEQSQKEKSIFLNARDLRIKVTNSEPEKDNIIATDAIIIEKIVDAIVIAFVSPSLDSDLK
jgi:hypothetical protein